MNRTETVKRWIFIFAGSLFLQIFCWVIYSRLRMTVWMCGLSALVTALLYHYIQKEEQTGLSRRGVFSAGILAPFLTAGAVCVTGLLRHPNMTLLGAQLDGVSPMAETAALYSARLLLNGVFLLLFAAADRVLLRKQKSGKEKNADEAKTA